MQTPPIVTSRGVVNESFALITPENLVANALPDLENVIVHPMATPRFKMARFGQYLLHCEPNARSVRPLGRGFESFLYQLEGEVRVETDDEARVLEPGHYCYVPSGAQFSLLGVGSNRCRLFWTKKRYEPAEGVPGPASVWGTRQAGADITPSPPAHYTYKELLPSSDPSYDMAMNVLTAPPGGSIGMVEMHHQEHGLLMLEGQGVYFLAGQYHPVRAGDYIYMAPYCPQSFWATGADEASYLLYKDVNRDGY